MKTVFIDCSPRKKGTASGLIADVTSVFTAGQKHKRRLKSGADYDQILNELPDTDNFVFSMPLYVDGVPSHILPFLKEAELRCRENDFHPNVYVIANNGFIEGRQNEPLMQVMENFCIRSGARWCGGLGIGGGIMMNVTRIMVPVFFGILIFNLLIAWIQNGDILPAEPLITFGKQMLAVLFFLCGILYFDIRLALCIRQNKNYGKHYTRIMMPTILFILSADIFFTIKSLIHGGLFRGWLSMNPPKNQ